MEVSWPQTTSTKNHTKTARSSRVVIQYVNRKILQFYKGYFINFYQMKTFEVK